MIDAQATALWRVTAGDLRTPALPTCVQRLPALAAPMHDVSVWLVRFDTSRPLDPRLTLLLTADEQQRCRGLRRHEDRGRFAHTRVALRVILGNAVSSTPLSLKFRPGFHGKPLLESHPSLHFSVVHSGELAFIAMSRNGPVGLDIEQHDHRLAVRDLIGTLQPREREHCQGVLRACIFYAIWVSKEAVLKCMGVGLGTTFKHLLTIPRADGRYLIELDGCRP